MLSPAVPPEIRTPSARAAGAEARATSAATSAARPSSELAFTLPSPFMTEKRCWRSLAGRPADFAGGEHRCKQRAARYRRFREGMQERSASPPQRENCGAATCRVAIGRPRLSLDRRMPVLRRRGNSRHQCDADHQSNEGAPCWEPLHSHTGRVSDGPGYCRRIRSWRRTEAAGPATRCCRTSRSSSRGTGRRGRPWCCRTPSPPPHRAPGRSRWW